MVQVTAQPGDRVLALLAAMGATSAPSADDPGTLTALLAQPSRSRSTMRMVAADEVGSLLLDLPRPQDGRVPTWTARVAAISRLGDPSPVAHTDVRQDDASPPLELDEAFLRPPWPLTASLAGRTEPGATVTHQGRHVTAGADGRFTFEAQLAPWPQRLTVRAADAAGNETIAVADVVGGPDLRGLPWPAIVVLGVLGGAVVAGLRRGPGSTVTPDRERPVLEDLGARRLQ
jgi:hypothetical protein